MRALESPSSALAAAGRLDAFRALGWLLMLGGVAVVLALAFTPWQQSVSGSGRVIAYAPLERQQAVEAPIDGRVVQWYVQEGDRVSAGDPIADLSDNDPEILDRLERERTSAQTQVDTAAVAITLTEARVASLEAARESAISIAQLRRSVAENDVEGAQQRVDAAKAKERTADLNLTRQTNLYDKGLASKRDLELAELAKQTATNDLERARASLRGARSEVKAYKAEGNRVGASNRAGIESTQSSLEKLRSDKAKAEGELAKVEVRLARQQQMQIVAPRAGTILRLMANQGTEMVKAGDPLVLLVPEVGSSAVELYVDGNDVPLVEEGRHVRLQFEGWPAVQFVGWPSVAVGTFGGTVAFVDAHDDGRGRFRVVIVPGPDDDWPEGRFLRQGVRANGWVLLEQVTLGFELWRQLNGFPPVVVPDDEMKTDVSAMGKEAG